MSVQQPDGIHHIAIMSANMKEQLTFFTQVMGFPLVGLFEMHGVPGGKHAFLRMDEDSFFSVVELAGIGEIPSTLGITHAGTGAGKCAAGVTQHIAFRVPDEAGLIAMRDRIRSHGVPAIGPIGHGFCKSIYFAGPEGLTLEVSFAVSKVDPARWVDPKMLDDCGITDDEAQAMLNPAPCTTTSPVAQPAFDPAKPQLAYPPETLKAILAAPDAAITMQGSYDEPPVAA
ncbi:MULTISPECIES: VOC family protein [unclassified Novosphingobium]|uniref:VOC family protein n=1 Tax=unclassified Novosphingobium TaxID=2644732 RepID=UPI0025CF8C45|nr:MULTISPECIES: VOC family protein [unclassified Novosphingobium]HQV03713.1 VOC family protein [Novosphingobium sp.]